MAIETAGMVLDSLMLSKLEAGIGDIRQSMLSEAAFNAAVFGVWKLMNGQTCVGTEYASITGSTNVPNAVTEGTFLRQAKAGRALGSYEADDNKSHSHGIMGYTRSGYAGDAVIVESPAGALKTALAGGTTSTGGAEARPKNIAVNHFIKVSHV